MEPLAALDRATKEFGDRLSLVDERHWDLPTPCAEWSVRALVGHVLSGNRWFTATLGGASAEEVAAIATNTELGADANAEFTTSRTALAAAFRADGALDRIYQHPLGPMPGRRYIFVRTVDITAHSWDLARATGLDETLDPELVEHLNAGLVPLAGTLAGTGRFGAGASGDLPADATPQARFLDVTGRRPG